MKNVLITGAASGIGKEISLQLKNEYNLILSSRRKMEIENYIQADLSDIASIENLVKSCNYDIDILINCAGSYIYKKIEEMSLDEINYLIDLNFKSAYILSKYLIPNMKQKRWGRIINIGSISAMVGEGYATLYSATKAALAGLTKALALELAEFNITVNTINPGWVETELGMNSIEDSEFSKDEIIECIPQKRFVKPEEVAKLCRYLISEDAKGITGQSINLCAGLSVGI